MPMTKGKRNRGSFKPGNNMNPKGGGARIPLLKAFKEYTVKAIAEMYTELMNLKPAEWQAIVDSKDCEGIKVLVAQILLRDMKSNDIHYTERILQRIIGPIPSVQEVGGPGGVPLPSGSLMPPVVKFEIVKHESLQNDPSNGNAPKD